MPENINEILNRRIEEWRQRLIDLTPRNRLLNFKPTKSSTLIVSAPDIDTIFNRLIADEKCWKFFMPPQEDDSPSAEENETQPQEQALFDTSSFDEIPEAEDKPKADELVCEGLDRKGIEHRLKYLFRQSHTYYQERGVRILYVGFGFLTWSEKETADTYQSPLILCPVELHRETALEPFELCFTEGDYVLNPALETKLKKDFNIELPKLPDDLEEKSLSAYLEMIEVFLKLQNWTVDKKVVISLFSFYKLVMYKDLGDNKAFITPHEIIRGLCGEKTEVLPEVDVADERQLDSTQKPEETYQILDADSSQQYSIQASLKGKSFILQGPPGTGKSQTIANIVAEFIARGKTVLFVSEKMAALEVVFKRLRDKGLGDFCLELHSHKANKREAVAELNRCLLEQLKPTRLPTQNEFEKLKQLRKELNQYVLALHEVRRPLDRSVYDILGEIAKVYSASYIPLAIKKSQIQPAQIHEWKSLVQLILNVWPVVEQWKAFPWFGCVENQFNLTVKEQWLSLLEKFSEVLNLLQSNADEFSKRIGVENPQSFDDVAWIIKLEFYLAQKPVVESNWFRTDKLNDLIDNAKQHQSLCDNYNRILEELTQKYNDGFFQIRSEFAKDFRERCGEVISLLGENAKKDQNLIKHGNDLCEIVSKIQSLTEELSNHGNQLLNLFDFPEEDSTFERMGELVQLVKLCSAKDRPEAFWFEQSRIERIKKLIGIIRPQYESYNERKRELIDKYSEGLFSDDIDWLIEKINRFRASSESVEVSEIYNVAQKILSRCLEKPDNLLNLHGFIEEWLKDINELGRLFELPTEKITVGRAGEVAEIANLCHTETPPESHWVSPEKLREVKNLVARIRPDYEDYSRRRKNLLQIYDESFLELDIDQLIENFNGLFHRPVLRCVNPKFYKDKKALLRTTRSASIPASIMNDMLEAREINRIRKRLDAERLQVKALFGKYDKGYETNFDVIEQAVKVGEEVLRFAGTSSLPDSLIHILSLGDTAPHRVHEIGRRVLSAVNKWKADAHNSTACLPLDDLFKVRKFLQIRKQLEQERENVKGLLGTYDNSYDTDFAPMERAISVAEDVARLSRTTQIPCKLIKNVAIGNQPEDAILKTGIKIEECLNKLGNLFRDLDIIVNTQEFPPTKQPFMEEPLLMIQLWAQDLFSLLPGICKEMENLLSYSHNNKPSHHVDLLSDLISFEKLKAIEEKLHAEDECLQRDYGNQYSGTSTLWQNILASLEWVANARKLFGNRPITERFVQVVTRKNNDISFTANIESIYYEARGLLSEIEERFNGEEFDCNDVHQLPAFYNPQRYVWKAFGEQSLTELKQRLENLCINIDDLQDWTDFKDAKNRFYDAGLETFLNSIIKSPPSASQVVDAYHKSVYQEWINFIFEEDPKLKGFRGQEHNQLIDEFRRIDRELLSLSAKRVIEQCNTRRPPVLIAAQDSEVALLKREAAKRRKHLPIRLLFERITNLLFRIKPCLLMSPLSVSQFLNPDKFKFDLVIFDEASQIFTEDAIGAIYRGKQLVVAGDSKQLPPTNFFKSVDDDGFIDEDESIDDLSSADFNSVLEELTVTQVSQYELRWHYRSRHEDLIAFSNSRYYANRLNTFPASRDKDEMLGIKFVYVPDGIYDRGGKRTNQKEADRIADIVFEHFAKHPRKSLGVVAFSQAQMAAIEDEIERGRRLQPEFEDFFKDDRLEGFFVKNLENVQGDERDVIIFSVGYGNDEQRRMTMNFGPLNKSGGERRLNVAITRAREKVVLVSSIKAADFDLSENPPAGVLNFYHYLDYAERGKSALELTHPMGLGEAESPLEVDVGGVIKQLGYDVVPQVGCSGYRIDIGVLDPVQPGHFLMGVECDGRNYHSSATARDRDRLREEVLINLGWKIHRIWSPDWIYKRDKEIVQLKQAIEDARKNRNNPSSGKDNVNTQSHKESAPQNPDVLRVAVPQIEKGSTIPGTIPYKICRLGGKWNTEKFYQPEKKNSHCNTIAQIVEMEGPIHVELASKRLTAMWGINRSGNRVMDIVKESIRLSIKRNLCVKDGDFLWPPKKLKTTPVRVPIEDIDETKREIEHIHPKETQNAMLLIVRHSVGIAVGSLISETARLFGFNRTGDVIKERLMKEYERLKKNEKIIEKDGYVSLSE